MNREELMQLLKDNECMVADGFDNCIIGIGFRCGQNPLIVYSTQKIIDQLIEQDGLTQEEAREHFDFNIAGAWVGPKTPIFVEMVDE